MLGAVAREGAVRERVRDVRARGKEEGPAVPQGAVVGEGAARDRGVRARVKEEGPAVMLGAVVGEGAVRDRGVRARLKVEVHALMGTVSLNVHFNGQNSAQQGGGALHLNANFPKCSLRAHFSLNSLLGREPCSTMVRVVRDSVMCSLDLIASLYWDRRLVECFGTLHS